MKETTEKVVRALSVPKVITVLCLVAMGVNGLLQLSLQRDMAAKTTMLKARVADAGQLTGQMNSGLAGLKPLATTSGQMKGTLSQVEALTAAMNQSLSALDRTVANINSTAKTIHGSVAESTTELATLHQSSQQLSQILSGLQSTNTDVVRQLNAMIADQQAINQNLAQMNAKTAILP